MSKFQELYKNITMPSLPLYGLGEIVTYGGYRWEITSFKPDKQEQCWVYDLKRVDGTDETETGIYELGLAKSYAKEIVEKPGEAQHSPKWDRCVQDVRESGSDANPYAVCTAMVGKTMFKSMGDNEFSEKIKFYMQKLGIAGAGPVPHSLLARQDLEGTEKVAKSHSDIGNFAVWYYDISGARKCAVFGNIIDAEAYAGIVDSLGYKDISIQKGQVEQTGKQLERLATKAEDATETSEQKSIIENIKAVQLRRQKATIISRAKETAKSFKENWSTLNKNNQ